MSISNVPEKVRYLLWAKSAGRCQLRGCNKPLWRDDLTQIEMNFADVAHIIGDRPKGPRGHKVNSKKLAYDVSNLMLLCLDHHRMIDEILEEYTDEELRGMKQEHEVRIERLTSIQPEKSSHVVIFKGLIGDHQPVIEFSDVWQAMVPTKYPASHLPIELGITNIAITDQDPDYWNIQAKNLKRQFERKIQPIIESEGYHHFSIFAFAPQPILVTLGTLFSDIYAAEVYQLHREPTTWEWLPGPSEFDYLVKPPETIGNHVALILSLSASINKERVFSAIDNKAFSIWEMTIEQPDNDFLKSHGQLTSFRQRFRLLLDEIKQKHGENAILHIFPAVPVAIAVEIGRVWQPKADLPLVIYDQNRISGGFQRAIQIRQNP